ncbi:Sterol 3-beta-glucosyltransferase [Globisporangium polare]
MPEPSSDHDGAHEQLKPQVPPPLSICIITIGTRGDVQPFLAVAKRLQQDGHRVRLATHDVYRAFITEHGIEFYPLGGDPKELSSYMVKTGGQLIPLNPKLLFRELPKNMKMVNEICNSTWPAVTAPDPDGGGAPGVPGEPFRAQAIISNPVTYGHVHIAEKLGVPLHIMFPQLWGPTAAFPHPLSSLSYKTVTKSSKRNLWSYKVVNLLLWLGSHSTVNDFRTEVLGLRKIRMGGRGRRLLLDLDIPHTFMWSPLLVPKPSDYNDRYDVVGTATLKLSDVEESFTPSPELTEFLENTAGDGRGPIFVGFGSMVLKHPEKTTRMIVEAAKLANARVLIQSNWSDMAAGLEIPDSVFFLDYCPHEWLLPRVAAVVHHGGAGTTAAGLRAGKPTFIVPFFGDQHFWARATVTAGVGIEPCSIDGLSVEKLKSAFEELQSPVLVANAHAMGLQMQREDGADAAVQHFYHHLPLEKMLCDSDTKSECSHVATKLRMRDERRFCDECAIAIRVSGDDTVSSTSSLTSSSSPQDALVEYQAVNYRTRGPESALKGALSGSGAFIHELGSGVKDFVARPVRGYRAKGARGAATGLARACGGVVMRPLHGAALLADHITTGHCNSRRLRDGNGDKRESVLLGPEGKLAAVERLCCGH